GRAADVADSGRGWLATSPPFPQDSLYSLSRSHERTNTATQANAASRTGRALCLRRLRARDALAAAAAGGNPVAPRQSDADRPRPGSALGDAGSLDRSTAGAGDRRLHRL